MNDTLKAIIALAAMIALAAAGVMADKRNPRFKAEQPQQVAYSSPAASLDHEELDNPTGAKRSSKWPAVRAAYLADHPVCAACGQADQLNVHHVVPFHFDRKLELDPSNLITLCTDGIGHTNCHLMIGHGGNYKCANPCVREDAARFNQMLTERTCGAAK